MTTKSTTRKSKATAAVAIADDHSSKSAASRHRPAANRDDIARRAFELYCDRGRQHGRDLDDWLLAEHELLDA